MKIFKALVFIFAISFITHEIALQKLQKFALEKGVSFDSIWYKLPFRFQLSQLKIPISSAQSLDTDLLEIKIGLLPLLISELHLEISPLHLQFKAEKSLALSCKSSKTLFKLPLTYQLYPPSISLDPVQKIQFSSGGLLNFDLGTMTANPHDIFFLFQVIGNKTASELEASLAILNARFSKHFHNITGKAALKNESVDFFMEGDGMEKGKIIWDGSFQTRGELPFVCNLHVDQIRLHTEIGVRVEYTGNIHLSGNLQDLAKNKSEKIACSSDLKIKSHIKTVSDTTKKLPEKLQSVPSADFVVNVKKVNVEKMDHIFNASLIEKDDHFFLVFRTENFTENIARRYPDPLSYSNKATFAAYVTLNRDFEPMDDPRTIDCSSICVEDARICKVGSDYFLVYNDFCDKGTDSPRIMKIAAFDLERNQILYMTDLDRKKQIIEKNWSPFEFKDEKGKTHLNFIYDSERQVILQLDSPTMNSLEEYPSPPGSISSWTQNWGKPRGGTPARLVNGEYLTFFHSIIKDDEEYFWYVMGAYTFEAKPPFRVTAISSQPILFDGIYNTPLAKGAKEHVRCIFPMGLALEKRDGKDLLHVSCGENDCAIKIITFDQEALLNSLQKIKE